MFVKAYAANEAAGSLQPFEYELETSETRKST